MSEAMPSPPEVAELDQDARELDHQRAELLLRWRWAIAGFIGIVLAELGLIVTSIATANEDLGAVAGGSFTIVLLGAGGCLAYATDNRNTRIHLDRELQRLKYERRDILAGRAKRSVAPYARYKEHLPFLAEHYKIRALRYRRTYIALQLIVITGSLSASAVTAFTGSSDMKVLAVCISLIVGISASCSLTFRLRERGEALQQTATDIEHEYRAAELKIGDYADKSDERDRYRILVERVESMRVEQARKERALDQPPDLNQSTSSGIGAV